jgi:hypothetical protein
MWVRIVAGLNIQDKEITKIIQSDDKVLEAVSSFISKASTRIVACVDQSRSALSMDNEQIKALILNFHNRGVKIRCITEMTINNIHYQAASATVSFTNITWPLIDLRTIKLIEHENLKPSASTITMKWKQNLCISRQIGHLLGKTTVLNSTVCSIVLRFTVPFKVHRCFPLGGAVTNTSDPVPTSLLSINHVKESGSAGLQN